MKLILLAFSSFFILSASSLWAAEISTHEAFAKVGCADATLVGVEQELAFHGYNASNMVQTTRENLRLLRDIRQSAHRAALVSSSMIIFGITVLLGFAVFKILTWPGLFRGRQHHFDSNVDTHRLMAAGFALLMGQIIFVSSIFYIERSADPTSEIVQNYKKMVTLTAMEIPQVNDKPSLLKFQGFIQALHRDMSQLPGAYHQAMAELPSETQWWTFGWDEVYKVDFEIAAVQALLERYSLESEGTKLVLPKIKKLCESPLVI